MGFECFSLHSTSAFWIILECLINTRSAANPAFRQNAKALGRLENLLPIAVSCFQGDIAPKGSSATFHDGFLVVRPGLLWKVSVVSHLSKVCSESIGKPQIAKLLVHLECRKTHATLLLCQSTKASAAKSRKSVSPSQAPWHPSRGSQTLRLLGHSSTQWWMDRFLPRNLQKKTNDRWMPKWPSRY